MGASVVLGRMEQTGLWGQAGDGPNKLMGQIEAWGKRRMGQTGLWADRTNGRSDVWVRGAFPCDKTRERISGISL